MIYILLAVVLTSTTMGSQSATISQEFNTQQTCMIAAAELRRQGEATGHIKFPVLMCIPKGDKR